MSDEIAYMDSSAITKLAIAESESAALAMFLGRTSVRATSALSTVEVIRAVRPHGLAAVGRARAVLGQMQIVGITEDILSAAANLEPVLLRSLDAIHVASALALGAHLRVVVTYDVRMQEAARAAGLNVVAPA